MLPVLYAHIVWTTRNRRPIINAEAARFLCRFLPAVARQERTDIVSLGIVATHLHLLVQLHPTTAIPRLLQRLKGGSAAVARREGVTPTGLQWAKGYSIHSVSPRQLAAAERYVRGQPERHPDQRIEGFHDAT